MACYVVSSFDIQVYLNTIVIVALYQYIKVVLDASCSFGALACDHICNIFSENTHW